MDRNPTAPALHAVLFTIPAQGHINPFLHFANLLASKACVITFIMTESSHKRMLQSQAQDTPHINFVTIPDGVPPGLIISGHETLRLVVDALEKQQELIEKLIAARLGTAPVTCLIFDLFLPWAHDLAKRLGVPEAILWTSSGSMLYMNSLVATQENLTDEEITRGENLHLKFPRLPLSSEDIVSVLPFRYPGWRERVSRPFLGIENTTCILVNTFHELDGWALDAVPFDIPVRPIGPLLPSVFLSKEGTVDRCLLQKGEEVCLKWLDAQAPSSVLYISFGSVFTLPPAQMEQLARAIQASEQPFLWVNRQDTESSFNFPEGFIDLTKDRGLVISWAPQLLVLDHSAVGGFLTHCGWNSTMESIFMGVPMLCWPILAEQPLTAKLVVKVWQIGMAFGRTADGLVEEEEVQRVVRALMQSEEGEQMRDRAASLRKVAQAAGSKGGSSDCGLEAFVADMSGGVMMI